ncbi:MAG: hypothetical protein PHV23_01660 [Candidatus Gracilibacteria bacterium]|nr:hypothetical protein [Candidatus Gracilibacteria bacterium]
MKKIISAIIIFLLLGVNSVLGYSVKYQKGYIKKNGTYVQGHYKTVSNSKKSDNFSTKGNYNPYTGKKGYTR